MTEIKERFHFMYTGSKSKDVFGKSDQGYNAISTGRKGVPEPHLNRKRVQI
jgi:hypothetical protein